MTLYNCISIGYNEGFDCLGYAIGYVKSNIQYLIPHDRLGCELNELKDELVHYGIGRIGEDGELYYDGGMSLEDALDRINAMNGTYLWFEEE